MVPGWAESTAMSDLSKPREPSSGNEVGRYRKNLQVSAPRSGFGRHVQMESQWCSEENDTAPSKTTVRQLSGQNEVQYKLSDSGHHEDLSPTDKEYSRDTDENMVYTKHISVKGHDLQLLLDDEKLLQVCN